MKRSIFLVPILISLSSCYPIYKTQKPQVTVTVVNEQGVAIADVKVVLVTAVHPAKIDDQYDEKFTNKLGIVNFEKQAQWKVESLMIHGCKCTIGIYALQKMAISHKNLSMSVKKRRLKSF